MYIMFKVLVRDYLGGGEYQGEIVRGRLSGGKCLGGDCPNFVKYIGKGGIDFCC